MGVESVDHRELAQKWWIKWGSFWDSIHHFMVVLWDLMAGWWFGTCFFRIGNVIIPTDQYFSEGLKPPTSITGYFLNGFYMNYNSDYKWGDCLYL